MITSNIGDQVGIKLDDFNEWQNSYKDSQIIINATVIGHSP